MKHKRSVHRDVFKITITKKLTTENIFDIVIIG